MTTLDSTTVARYWPYATKRDHDEARRLAGHAVRAAVKSGALKRQACERCPRWQRGPVPRAEAHHDDYARPLDVTWLCRRHHRERHRELVLRPPTPEQWEDTRLRTHRRILMSCPATQPLVKDATTQVLEAMQRREVTQADLSRLLGASPQHVGQWFHGGIRTLKSLAAVCDAIGCDVVITIVDRATDDARKAS